MTSCSVTLRPDEEFAVAVAAEDRRGDRAVDAPAERSQEGGDVVAHRSVDGRVAHDAFLEIAALRLELRLDQRNQVCALGEQAAEAGSTSLSEMKLTSSDGKIRRLGQQRGIERADIGLLERDDVGASAQTRMQLAACRHRPRRRAARRVRAAPR